MELLTAQDRARLLANGQLRRQAETETPNLNVLPVVKLFTPDADCTWLLTELDPEDTDRAFGLCDLGLGFPELGYVSLAALSTLRGRLNLPVERDRHFAAARTLSAYAAEARASKSVTA
ncbi:MAG TPA: DUF2958 domain-containing protein [Longimicrobiales bacterium]|nr:DUF2958 domain-containing protein [Longimicrobiales bacterium]